jgi:signal transduction histidine kinase/ligand-binding sensor domain-containing protein
MRFGIIIFLLLFSQAKAQQYRFHQYRVEQGLPSDVVKAVTQDSLGFIWIATDDGLVKYDGLRFTTYKSAVHSQYTKGFLRTRDGRLLAFGDLDLIEIRNQIDTVIFKCVLPGERSPTDSTIWYPKSIYEDKTGNLWLGEPKSVLRYDGESFERFDFGERNRSPVFVRSFCFFEDQHDDIFAVSYQGRIFRFDKLIHDFIELGDAHLPEDISQVLFYKNNLLIAARNGLYTATLENSQIKDVTNVFPIANVSNLLIAPDSSVLVTTYDEDLYRVNFKNGFMWENILYNFKGINSCFMSREGDIWVATDKGVVLVQKNLFLIADINSQASFVEGITSDDEKGIVYYCNKETLVELRLTEESEWERNVLYENKDSYFQCLQFGKGMLWAATSANVLLFKNGHLEKVWDFSDEGSFVHDIFFDSRNNVWVSQAGSQSIRAITDSMTIGHYNIPAPKKDEVNLIREGSNGIYAAASGIGHYLFFKGNNESEFRNISLPISFAVQGDFNITDLAIQNDILWFASTAGLLKYDHRTISRVDLGEVFSSYSVSSVEFLDKENILFANSYGLFRYNLKSKEYWLFDENAGLPSNTVTDHGILVTAKKELWVGTSYGLAYALHPVTENKATATPYCVNAQVNGESKRFVKGLYAPYGSFINLQFSPITFPENKIHLQWRMQGTDTVWRTIDNRQLSLSDLKAGIHTVQVRAKKNTGLGWSEPTSLKIIVSTPYWKRVEFIFLILLVITVVAWISYAVSYSIAKSRRAYLQNLITRRTMELQKANEELTLRNTELDRFVYSASHDLSAPLKSILGLISVARLDKPGESHEQYLSMMERSVLKLEEFIEEVVSYSRNTRMPVKLESFDFTEFVKGMLQDHHYSPNYCNIEFIVEDSTSSPMVSDVTRMKIILNNLISNAIKFHWIDGKEKPFVKISLARCDGHYQIVVEDNGRGISERHLHRIFEMFYRATEEAPGSGLGLYILKESVAKLGGSVEAKSAIEEGTSFIIKLPVQTES